MDRRVGAGLPVDADLPVEARAVVGLRFGVRVAPVVFGLAVVFGSGIWVAAVVFGLATASARAVVVVRVAIVRVRVTVGPDVRALVLRAGAAGLVTAGAAAGGAVPADLLTGADLTGETAPAA